MNLRWVHAMLILLSAVLAVLFGIQLIVAGIQTDQDSRAGTYIGPRAAPHSQQNFA